MFSPSEQKIIKIIGNRKMKIIDITREFYKGKRKKNIPLNNNSIIAGMIRRISAKCSRNELPWVINGEGAGRAGKTVWKTKINWH